MPSFESLPGEFGGAACSIGFGLKGGTTNPDTDAFRDIGTGEVGSGDKLRDQGSSRRGEGGGDPGFTRGLGGIISSSRIRVGGSSERGGKEWAGRRGSGREAVKMPRPKTAGAAIGRGDPVVSAGSSGGTILKKKD